MYPRGADANRSADGLSKGFNRQQKLTHVPQTAAQSQQSKQGVRECHAMIIARRSRTAWAPGKGGVQRGQGVPHAEGGHAPARGVQDPKGCRLGLGLAYTGAWRDEWRRVAHLGPQLLERLHHHDAVAAHHLPHALHMRCTCVAHALRLRCMHCACTAHVLLPRAHCMLRHGTAAGAWVGAPPPTLVAR